MRTKLYWAGVALVLVVTNKIIWQQETLVSQGQTILLRLAPVDPRSLMQGDYMILNYRISITAKAAAKARNGYLVVSLDKDKVATFVRLQNNSPLKANERLLRYRIRNGNVFIGATSFFFQEGHAKVFAKAKFGELKVTPAGDTVLVGLRDADKKPLGPKRW